MNVFPTFIHLVLVLDQVCDHKINPQLLDLIILDFKLKFRQLIPNTFPSTSTKNKFVWFISMSLYLKEFNIFIYSSYTSKQSKNNHLYYNTSIGEVKWIYICTRIMGASICFKIVVFDLVYIFPQIDLREHVLSWHNENYYKTFLNTLYP